MIRKLLYRLLGVGFLVFAAVLMRTWMDAPILEIACAIGAVSIVAALLTYKED